MKGGGDVSNIKKLVPITGSAVTGESYDGAYTVTPSRKAQVLQTANKVLADNVTVLAISFSVTSNTAGGETFYIAKGE